MIKNNIFKSITRTAKKTLFPVPSHISRNFLPVETNSLQAIRKSLKKHYYVGWRSKRNYSKEGYQADLEAHLYQRIQNDRQVVIPWIDDAVSLEGKQVLEIGCGTGSSSVAIAEQGATVTGTDIDEGAIAVAEARAVAYGVDVSYQKRNAQEITRSFDVNRFDIIMFFACLEHMTISERLISLRDAWAMLPVGGLLIIVETPNRLWYYDDHTAWLPFFHWLPNELAFQYTRFSERENFNALYDDYTSASAKEHFLRRGRGMSFHETDIAIGPARELNIISSLSSFQGFWYKSAQSRLARQYKDMLMKIYPGVHEGFFDNYLYLIIKKQAAMEKHAA